MARQLLDYLDSDWRRTVETVRQAAVRMWKVPVHRDFTDHTVDHCERVMALLDGLTAGMMGTDRRLSPMEVFVLLAAAYLHDIGMQDERYGGLDEIRSQHHGLSAELIYGAAEDPAHAVQLGLPDDPGLIEAVALVAKGHRQVDLADPAYDPLIHGGETLRLRLLAALLRFADELDIDHRRVDLERMKLMNLPLVSQFHWWRCHYVSGVRIEDEYIRIAYRFPQCRPDYGALITPLVERDIRAKLADLEEIFRPNAIKVAIAKSQVRLLRLVKPLPADVEVLAKEILAGKPAGTLAAETAEPGAAVEGAERAQPPAGSTTYSVHIERASGLAIGNGARVIQSSSPVPGAGDAPGGGGASAGAVPAGWTSAALRRLVSLAFGDEALMAFCYDHFRAVYEGFSAGMGKGQKVQRLLEHCERYGQLERLLALVKKENPVQYERVRSQGSHDPPVSG